MAFFQTRGGAILQVDVPAEGHALERHEEQIEAGDLVPVDEGLVEEYVEATELMRDGTTAEYRKFRLRSASDKPKTAARASKAAEAQDD